jgi:hypothetical protein
MLDVRNGPRDSADDGRVEWAAGCREEEDGHGPARQLEAARGDVVVWHAVTGEVDERPESGRPAAPPAQGAGQGPRGDVK